MKIVTRILGLILAAMIVWTATILFNKPEPVATTTPTPTGTLVYQFPKKQLSPEWSDYIARLGIARYADEFSVEMGSCPEATNVACYRYTSITITPSFYTNYKQRMRDVIFTHEYLHYVRYRNSLGAASNREKQNAIEESMVAFAKTRPRLWARVMDGYGDLDAEGLKNETHSIVCTEVANLPADINQYCGQYFNRGALTYRY